MLRGIAKLWTGGIMLLGAGMVLWIAGSLLWNATLGGMITRSASGSASAAYLSRLDGLRCSWAVADAISPASAFASGAKSANELMNRLDKIEIGSLPACAGLPAANLENIEDAFVTGYSAGFNDGGDQGRRIRDNQWVSSFAQLCGEQLDILGDPLSEAISMNPSNASTWGIMRRACWSVFFTLVNQEWTWGDGVGQPKLDADCRDLIYAKANGRVPAKNYAACP